MSDIDSQRSALRRRIKAQRRALSLRDRDRTALQFAKHARELLRPQMRIAVYSAIAGEASVEYIVDFARALGCAVHLPVISNHRTRKMIFVRWDAEARMRQHRWGFLEPMHREPVRVRSLDLVFVPAVAVDDRGMRIGAGAGFYDRAFHFRLRTQWHRPKLVALVYDFQRVPHVPAHAWDVPVDGVLSETGLRWCRRNDAPTR